MLPNPIAIATQANRFVGFWCALCLGLCALYVGFVVTSMGPMTCDDGGNISRVELLE